MLAIVTHASALDIPVLYANLPFQFRIVFKKELLSYPLIGGHLRRSGQVCINQQNPTRSIADIRSGKARLQNIVKMLMGLIKRNSSREYDKSEVPD